MNTASRRAPLALPLANFRAQSRFGFVECRRSGISLCFRHIDLDRIHEVFGRIKPGVALSAVCTSSPKGISGSGRDGRLRLMRKYIGYRLIARPELDNTFWTASTYKISPPKSFHL